MTEYYSVLGLQRGATQEEIHAAFFIATKYLPIAPYRIIPLTDESTARFLWHTMAFVSISWPIFWFVRFYDSLPKREMYDLVMAIVIA